MYHYVKKSTGFLSLLFISFFSKSQTTTTYTTATTWNVPAGVSSISIKVYGGAGGTGGQDCGAGCTNAAASQVGYVVATFSVSTGQVVGIYPGGKGSDGLNNVTGTGGGAGGTSGYSTAYRGGTGGNAGSSGASGGGGGGGAASVVTVATVVKIVAGGAGGGGGMANASGSGLAGSNTPAANGTNNFGGNGATPSGDGGGAGAGGGGNFGSVGGTVYAISGESAGNGGFRGTNSVSGASIITSNTSIAWTSGGQIEITYSVLPVTWLSFTGNRQNNTGLLRWSTAAEQNTKDYLVERSNNAVDWINVGTVAAAGNSSVEKHYQFTDANPLRGINYYRLLQRDINSRISYSDLVAVKFTDITGVLKIYPNPVQHGITTVTLKEASTVKVYNSIGALLIQKEFAAGDHPLDVSSLSKGTYYMKVNTEATVFIIQ